MLTNQHQMKFQVAVGHQVESKMKVIPDKKEKQHAYIKIVINTF